MLHSQLQCFCFYMVASLWSLLSVHTVCRCFGETCLAFLWRCIWNSPRCFIPFSSQHLQELTLHVLTRHHRDAQSNSEPCFENSLVVFRVDVIMIWRWALFSDRFASTLKWHQEIPQCNKEVNVYITLTFFRNMGWKQIVIKHAATVLKSFVLLLQIATCSVFSLKVLFSVTDQDLSQIGLYSHLEILPWQIPHVLSEMKLECPPPHNMAYCFSSAFPLKCRHSFLWMIPWPAWISSLEGILFEWLMLGNTIYIVLHVWYSLWCTPWCQFSLVLPAYEL